MADNAGRPSSLPYDAYIQRAIGTGVANTEREKKFVLPKGFPFLVSRRTQEVVGDALGFLASRHLTIRVPPTLSGSSDSVNTVTSDLKDFYDYLDASELALEEVDEEVLQGYVDSMTQSVSPVTKHPYQSSTVLRRLGTIRHFCDWAQGKGLLRHRIEARIVQVRRGEHVREVRMIAPNVVAPCALPVDDDVRVLSREEAQRLLDELGPRPDVGMSSRRSAPATTTQQRVRNRIIAECALNVGLRRSEILGLRIADVLRRDSRNLHPFAGVPVRVLRKGGRWATVVFPNWLVQRIGDYISTERAEAVAQAKARRPDYAEPENVFLCGTNSPNRVGMPLGRSQLNRIFHDAQLRIGMVRQERDEGGKPAPLYRFHHLRHTYAVWTYWARKSDGDAEPWKFIQAQLGHANLSTTVDLYLRATTLFEASVSDHYVSALSQLGVLDGHA